MSKVVLRRCRTIGLFIPLVLVGGCMGGALDQPTSPEVAMELEVHPVDPPDNIKAIAVGLGAIPYCPLTEVFNRNRPQPVNLLPGVYWRPFDGSAEMTRVPVSSYGYAFAFNCQYGQTIPLVRFFGLGVSFAFDPPSGNGPSVPWISHDTIVAYTEEAAAFTPFAPSDQSIQLSPGYTVLRRTCVPLDRADGGGWQLRVGSPEERIEFYPPASTFFPQPSPLPSALLEQNERALLEGCGIRPPPLDLGKRLSFDRAASLVFSANDQELVYLLPIDRADPLQGAALRSIRLADGSVRQLGIVPDGREVQSDARGNVYVSTETNLVQAEVQADGSTVMKTLPIAANGRVSPDGRWIVYWDLETGALANKVWDVAAGVEHVLSLSSRNLPLLTWSPESLLVSPESGSFTYDIIAPADGQLLKQFHADSWGYSWQLTWGIDGPVQLVTPTIWTPQQRTSPPNVQIQGPDMRVFGLVMEDLVSGGVSSVLDAQAGAITFAANALGTSLVWARKCLGLFETVCSFDLHRVRLPAAGKDEIVAVADSAAPVALSLSGRRFAIAARDGIYIRDLP